MVRVAAMDAVDRPARSLEGRWSLVALLLPALACGTEEVVFPAGTGVAEAGLDAPSREFEAPEGAPSEGAPSELAPADGAPADTGRVGELDGATPPIDDSAVAPTRGDEEAGSALSCSERANPPYAPSCSALPLTDARFTASAALEGARASNAFDGDTCTAWRAGRAPPQWIEVELCTAARCAPLPRVSRIGLYVDRDATFTVELQGSTAAGRLVNAFHTMASASITAVDGYADVPVGAEAEAVMRVLVNSGPAVPVTIREVVFLACP